MKYFINVARGDHEGGTKFYDVWGLIARPDHDWSEAKIVLIQNWGRLTSARALMRSGIHKLSGQYKINYFDKSAGADTFYKTIKASKEDRGYDFGDSKVVFESDSSGDFWNKICNLAIDQNYDPDIAKHLFGHSSPAPEIKPQTNTSSTTFKDKSINDPLWGVW